MNIFGCRHRTISYDALIQLPLFTCQNKTVNMAETKTLRLQKVESKTSFVIIFLESVVSDGFADSHITLCEMFPIGNTLINFYTYFENTMKLWLAKTRM